MPLLKIFLVVIIGMFMSTAVNAGSISVRQIGYAYISMIFNVTYEYDGKQLCNSSGVMVGRDNKTIEIPDQAVNINLTAYDKYWNYEPYSVIFQKFYLSSIRSCFSINYHLESVEWFEEPCQKLPANGEYSISICQIGNYPVFSHLKYRYNGSNLTERSAVWDGGKRTIQIPDGATNITFILYNAITEKMIVENFYPLPVEKCFEIHGALLQPLWLERPCQNLPAEHDNFISVHQHGTRPIQLKVVYKYSSTNLTEYIGGLSNGGHGAIQIPDKATNINVTIYKELYLGTTTGMHGQIEMIFTDFYEFPVKKCFQVYSYIGGRVDTCFEESCPTNSAQSFSIGSLNLIAIIGVLSCQILQIWQSSQWML